MKAEALLEGLRELARQLDLNVRFETGKFTGGYCILNEDRLIVINKRLPVEVKVAVLAKSLATLPLDDVFIQPAVRDYIEEERAKEKMHRVQRERDAVRRDRIESDESEQDVDHNASMAA